MLKVLAIIGIVIGSLVLLALLMLLIVLFVPFRYKISGSNKDTLYAYFLVTFFLSFFRLRIYYKEKMGWASLRLFGIKIFDKKIPELIEFMEKLSDKFSKNKKDATSEEDNKATDKEEQEALPESETEEYEVTLEEAEAFINEHDEIEDMGPIEKNISFLSSLKEFVLNIKKKWYNFKEFVKEKLDQWERTKRLSNSIGKFSIVLRLNPRLYCLKTLPLR